MAGQWYSVREYPWLTEHDSPSVSLARGVQTGSAIVSNFLRGKALQIEQSDSMLRQTKHVADQQNLNAINEGYAALSATMADISKNGAFGEPSAKQRFFDVVKRYPFVVRTPGFNGFVDAFKTAEQTAARAELSGVMSSIKGDYSPENEVRFWEVGARRPELMPEMEKLHAATFKHAADAKYRKELVQTTFGGRMDLGAQQHEQRMELWGTRLDRMADMKLDDQDFKTQFEGLQQEHRLERDRAKASTGVQERFDLNKSDEIAFRSELQSLQTAFNQGVVDQDSFSKLQESVITKYKAKARPAQQGGTKAPVPTSEPVKVNSQADFDALPVGALFINPADGKVLRKK